MERMVCVFRDAFQTWVRREELRYNASSIGGLVGVFLGSLFDCASSTTI